jgi:hypothetical protein
VVAVPVVAVIVIPSVMEVVVLAVCGIGRRDS